MKAQKLLSVIIPVYNVKQYLNRCVKSVISQANSEFEIILVDDGSSDGSETICDNLYYKYKDYIKVIHKENGGLSSARNAGLVIATGKYIFFLDSDDCISNVFMETVYDDLKSETFDIIEFGCCWEREFNSYNPHYSKHKFELSGKDCIENILKNKTGNEICLKIYKKALFNHLSFPEGRNYEDIATCYLLLMKANRVLCIKSEIYIYNITNVNSITKSVSLKNMTDMYVAVNELCNGVKEFCINNGIDSDYIEYYKRHSYIYIYIKLKATELKSSELKKNIEEYLTNHNHYNMFKFRHYDLKRWIYYEINHILGRM